MSRIERIYDTKTAKFKEIRDTVDEIYEANSRVTGKAQRHLRNLQNLR